MKLKKLKGIVRAILILFILTLLISSIVSKIIMKFQLKKLEEVTFVEMVDPTKLIVSDNGTKKTIRLIGVKEPAGIENTEYSDIITDYVDTVISEGDTLYLQKQKKFLDQDAEGSLYYYVWIERPDSLTDSNELKKSMFNMILIHDGYAVPDLDLETKYDNWFKLYEKLAKNHDNGLWKYEDFIQLVASDPK
jgi:hypothetical protein